MVSFSRCDNVALLATFPEKRTLFTGCMLKTLTTIDLSIQLSFLSLIPGVLHTHTLHLFGVFLSSLPFHRRNMQGKERLRHLPGSQTAHRRVTQTGRREGSLCSLDMLLVLAVCCFSLARFMGVFILVMFCRLVRDSGGRNIDRHSSGSTRWWVAKIEQQWRKDVDLTNIAELREQAW